jgi:hypothetical protein
MVTAGLTLLRRSMVARLILPAALMLCLVTLALLEPFVRSASVFDAELSDSRSWCRNVDIAMILM